jgi:flavin reductase (NADH)
MPRKPIVARVQVGVTGQVAAEDELREALARWASGVAVLAVRREDTVQAMTVTAVMAVSLRPPLVAVAVGEQAPLATLLDEGSHFALSFLGAAQRRWANVFADAFAVDVSGFPAEGDPVLEGAPAALVCRVEAVLEAGDHGLVIGLVERVELGSDPAPLLYHDRRYHAFKEEA